jgi:hypothetical protein
MALIVPFYQPEFQEVFSIFLYVSVSIYLKITSSVTCGVSFW